MSTCQDPQEPLREMSSADPLATGSSEDHKALMNRRKSSGKLLPRANEPFKNYVKTTLNSNKAIMAEAITYMKYITDTMEKMTLESKKTTRKMEKVAESNRKIGQLLLGSLSNGNKSRKQYRLKTKRLTNSIVIEPEPETESIFVLEPQNYTQILSVAESDEFELESTQSSTYSLPDSDLSPKESPMLKVILESDPIDHDKDLLNDLSDSLDGKEYSEDFNADDYSEAFINTYLEGNMKKDAQITQQSTDQKSKVDTEAKEGESSGSSMLERMLAIKNSKNPKTFYEYSTDSEDGRLPEKSVTRIRRVYKKRKDDNPGVLSSNSKNILASKTARAHYEYSTDFDGLDVSNVAVKTTELNMPSEQIEEEDGNIAQPVAQNETIRKERKGNGRRPKHSLAKLLYEDPDSDDLEALDHEVSSDGNTAQQSPSPNQHLAVVQIKKQEDNQAESSTAPSGSGSKRVPALPAKGMEQRQLEKLLKSKIGLLFVILQHLKKLGKKMEMGDVLIEIDKYSQRSENMCSRSTKDVGKFIDMQMKRNGGGKRLSETCAMYHALRVIMNEGPHNYMAVHTVLFLSTKSRLPELLKRHEDKFLKQLTDFLEHFQKNACNVQREIEIEGKETEK